MPGGMIPGACVNSDVRKNGRDTNMDNRVAAAWWWTTSLPGPIAIHINLSLVTIVGPVSWVPDVLCVTTLVCFGGAC